MNERPFTVRPMEAKSVHISHGYQFGSCPYVYGVTDDGTRFLGKVLTGRDALSRRGWYYKEIPGDTRSVVIRERDPEVTYLDALRILGCPSSILVSSLKSKTYNHRWHRTLRC